jgi:DNA (cytosine-5)-methyltransferase 1
VTLPDWGFLLGGDVFPLPRPAHLIYVTESGLLPTPRVSRGFTNPTLGKQRNDCLTTAILGEPVLGMRPNPRYVEWMMGLPIGWTELRGAETPKFQEWLHLHGDPSADPERLAA